MSKIDLYRSGDIVNGVKLIKHLTSGTCRRSLFECTVCKKEWNVVFSKVKNENVKCCQQCRVLKSIETLRKNPPLKKIKTSDLSLKNKIFWNIKYSARRRKINFNLSQSFTINLVMKNCFYCGSIPSQIKKNEYFTLFHHGVDRMNNNIGYIESNVVSCCITCNRGKNSMKYNEWLSYLNQIKNYLTNY